MANKKMLTVKDIETGRHSWLATDPALKRGWLGSSSYYEQHEDSVVFYFVDIQKDTVCVLWSLPTAQFFLNNEAENAAINILGGNDSLVVASIGYQKLYWVNYRTQQVSKKTGLPAGVQYIDLDASVFQVALGMGNAIRIIDWSGKVQKVCISESPDMVLGKPAHRREFGIEKGLFWSPHGNYLAFYKIDQSQVEDYLLQYFSTVPSGPVKIKYPMAGRSTETVNLGVYNVKKKCIVFIEKNEAADHYITSVTWSPDERFMYAAMVNRDQNLCKLKKYSALSGKFVATLFEEADDKYVEPQHAMFFMDDGSDKFVWQSRRDGYNHLYLYTSNGTQVKQLTKGRWEVTELLGYNQQEGKLYFGANMLHPTNGHICSVDIHTRETDVLFIGDKGTGKALFNQTADKFMYTFSSIANPGHLAVYGNNLKKMHQQHWGNPLEGYSLGGIELDSALAADDSTMLYYRLVKPAGFEKTKKYPLILYVLQWASCSIGKRPMGRQDYLWQLYMAQHGFVSLTIDGRGSANRGLAFESCIFGHLGENEAKDQVKVLQSIVNKGFVDTLQMGIHGWSYGGFMALNLMLGHKGMFKACVAGGPVTNWAWYEVMYTERYMDMPLNNRDGYENSNLCQQAENINGDVLLVHGSLDSTVVWQHSLNFIEQAIKKANK
ncbi:MAG: prolyl oligopeptidase family serine peptidase [Bacteroidales bacterium]|nr:prolyl oligopeptidase family serine peptidase [Bacteroidales bacterium]